MRKQIAMILISALLLCGCSTQISKLEAPVQFYYCTAGDADYTEDPVISPETRECAGMGSVETIIDLYLHGPESASLTSPFPENLKLIHYTLENSVAYVTFSPELASLNNLELTLACGCITMTVLELTGAEQICISAENELLNGQETVTMDRNSLQLLDTAAQTQ